MSIQFNKDSSFYRNEYPNLVQNETEQIGAKFAVESFAFDRAIIPTMSIDFSGKSTDIQKALDQVYNKFYGKNIGAVILASDGIYNEGLSPVFSSKISDLVPIFTIGLGDTSQQKDLFIEDIAHNNISFLGNDFIVETDIKAYEFENEDYKVQLLHQGKVIESKTIQIDSIFHQQTISWTISANNVGIQKYTVILSALDNEITYLNNEQSFYIDIVDSRQKVLILGDAPHPDIGAIKAALVKNKNYEVEVKYAKDFNSSFNDYSLIIYHNLPSAKNPLIIETVQNRKLPKIFIVGTATDLERLTALNQGFSSNASRGSESVQLQLNESFDLFKYDGEWKKAIENYPPLFSPYANYKFSSAANILAYQSVAGVKKDVAALVFIDNAGSKTTFVMGEGIWRWRLNEGKQPTDQLIFDALMEKLVQITSSKEDRSRLRIEAPQEINEQSSVVFQGEFYNNAFQLFNQPELKLQLTQEDVSNTFDYSFLKQQEKYQLDLGALPPGDYKWSAFLEYNGEKFEKNGVLAVKKIDREGLVTKANHQLLRDLSRKSNGKYLHVNSIDQLSDLLTDRKDIQTTVYTSEKTSDLMDWKWLFFVVIICFSIEWLLRKFNGAL